MAESENDIWLIVASVWKGNATPEEKKIFEAWLNEREENKQFYHIINRIVPVKKPYDEEMKRKVYDKIKETIVPKKVSRKIRFWRYGFAASLALMLVSGVGLFVKKSPLPSEMAYIEAQTPFGIRSKLSLPDGTTVYLNSGSYLKYPSVFSGKQRLVILKGEAYFEVARDTLHPFIVQTAQIDIKVFGTHFNVKAYQEDGLVQTTLLEGSVGLYKKADVNRKYGVKLMPNQQATYNAGSSKLSVKKVDASLSAVWREGKYYFENEPFVSIAKKLERNFNVNIRITSPELENELFYGMFTKDKNIFQLLDVMKAHNNFTYTVQNDTILIHRN
jgi:transmembrane sensor